MAHIQDHFSHHQSTTVTHANYVMPNATMTNPNSATADHHIHGMHMTFWFGCKLGDFLFRGLIVDSVGQMTVTCLVMMALGFVFEILKVRCFTGHVKDSLPSIPMTTRCRVQKQSFLRLKNVNNRYILQTVQHH